MKIINTPKPSVTFYDLIPGDVFKYPGSEVLYLKVIKREGRVCWWSCVRLSDGEDKSFSPTATVEQVKGSFVQE